MTGPDRSICPDERGYSQEDKRFISKVKESLEYCDGHYVIPLPFRESNVMMPNNKDQAAKRAIWQRKKMLRHENYRNDYVDFVNDVIAKGYARKVPDSLLQTECGNVWYIPQHAIHHPKKPGEIHVVFDCSARNQSTSLNEQQQQQQHFILHKTDYSFIKYRYKIEKKEYMHRKTDSGGKIIVMCKEVN